MARRYDTRTTIFSPDGRLYQVEYAIEAISQAGSAIGILARQGVVLAAEKRIHSKLLDMRSPSEKLFKIDDHIVCAVAGITADANILINYARLAAQQYYYQYQELIPMEVLLHQVCDLKQGYTQHGGLRPFGVAFLFGGWDKHHGFQLFQSDPSGNYGGWKAFAIGANNQTADSMLKSDYLSPEQKKEKEKKEKEKEKDKEGKIKEVEEEIEEDELKHLMDLPDAILLSLKVLAKTMDTTLPSSEKVELCTVTQDDSGQVVYKLISKTEIEDLLKKAFPPSSSPSS